MGADDATLLPSTWPADVQCFPREKIKDGGEIKVRIVSCYIFMPVCMYSLIYTVVYRSKHSNRLIS